jgi:hypothetical protein
MEDSEIPFLVWFPDTEPGEPEKSLTKNGLKLYWQKYHKIYNKIPENKCRYNRLRSIRREKARQLKKEISNSNSSDCVSNLNNNLCNDIITQSSMQSTVTPTEQIKREKPIKPKELKCGTPAYHKWWREQKKLNDPEYVQRKLEGDRRRRKKWYEAHKHEPAVREEHLNRMKEYYKNVLKPKKEALKKI